MIMNIFIIVFVLSITYAWMIRGVFSSMIHLLCVIVAGAIAFAVWEPLAMILVNMSPERGFLSFIESIAWGVSLVVPFVVALIILRVVTDKVVSGNISNTGIIDYVGGGVCGVAIAVICAGITVLGIGSMRVSTDFMGYQPLWYSTDRATGAGSLVKADRLWIPVDTVVAKMYSQLSEGSMSSNQSLAKWYPELEIVGFSTRVSPSDGKGRNAINPDDFKIKSSYTVGNPKGSDSIADLLKDSRDSQSQRYLDINSEAVSKGHLVGYVIDFEPGAKERGQKGGQLVVSNGQYRLLIEDNDGNTMSAFPVAVISESSMADQYGRWRFDANDVFITSVGGKSRVSMAFEYVVPTGYSPIALFVKNIRTNTATLPEPIAFATPAARDRIVRTGSILKGETASRLLNKTNIVTHDPSDEARLIRQSFKVGQMMSSQIAKRGMTLNEKNRIVDGNGSWNIKTDVGRKNAPLEKKLRVDSYALSKGQSLIRVDLSADTAFGLFSDAAREALTDQPLMLIDDKGNEYEAIGYEYSDSKVFEVRYTRGSTLSGIEDMPGMSRSRSDQKLIVLFIVTERIKIEYFTIGDVAIAEFDPPLETRR